MSARLLLRRFCATAFVAAIVGATTANGRAATAPLLERPSVDPTYSLPGASRTFAIEYHAVIPAVAPGTKVLRVWIPVPQNSDAQTIRGLSFSDPPQLTRGEKFGNRFAYWEITDPRGAVERTMWFVCTRREVRANLAALAADGEEPRAEFASFRTPDRHVAVNARIQEIATQLGTGSATTLERASAIYAYVLRHMAYDKTKPGWGTGSSIFACENGCGNCTDFHAFFSSLCIAEGIASSFEIGLYLPYDESDREPLSGYHCWAYFRVPGKTWVPVDCSEARRHPDRREYFFGSHTNNRVALSVGRDLVLEPKQHGAPLNFFVNPYAEADGEPVTANKTWTFANIQTTGEHSS